MTQSVMKKYLLIMAALFCMSGLFAQDEPQGRAPRMSPEEYKARQQEFITRRAELTEIEAAAFFPVYFQLQKQKIETNGQLHRKMRDMRKDEITEEEATALVEEMADMKIKCDQLDKDYLKQFLKIIPAKKMMKVQMAEEEFRRELLRDMERGREARPQGNMERGRESRPQGGKTQRGKRN